MDALQQSLIEAVRNHGPWKIGRLVTYLGVYNYESDVKNAILSLVRRNQLELSVDWQVSLAKTG